MTPNTRESVRLVPCELRTSATLECFGGPFDGERKRVDPKRGFSDLFMLWHVPDDGESDGDIYQSVIRFRGNTCYGFGLTWVPR